jgi:acyl phosphate:glycerol-3-phosphate acyltransferase
MTILIIIFIILISYLLGSLPSGLIVVKLLTGNDIRLVESGRTGGTNAMRAAGFWAGLVTTILDILKSAASVWLAQALLPGISLMHVVAPIMAILGHNYSIFLVKRDKGKNLMFSGGAGGAPAVGGALGLWSGSIFVTVPVGIFILYFIGYASLATISVALVSTILFAYRTYVGDSPWEYILYGILAGILLIWSLRPNIKRLFNGTERLVGLRSRRKNSTKKENPTPNKLDSPG